MDHMHARKMQAIPWQTWQSASPWERLTSGSHDKHTYPFVENGLKYDSFDHMTFFRFSLHYCLVHCITLFRFYRCNKGFMSYNLNIVSLSTKCFRKLPTNSSGWHLHLTELLGSFSLHPNPVHGRHCQRRCIFNRDSISVSPWNSFWPFSWWIFINFCLSWWPSQYIQLPGKPMWGMTVKF